MTNKFGDFYLSSKLIIPPIIPIPTKSKYENLFSVINIVLF